MSRSDSVVDAVRETGLVEPGSRVLAMLSGGADSVCLLHVLVELLGREQVVALHVDHGLRPASEQDARYCESLCERLGVGLEIERVRLEGPGNVEARAREARYSAAERARERLGLDLIATGHTASDQVETVLYRLASSPGRRALIGIRPSSAVLVRPLLGLWREQARDYCRAAGLEWREDETNLDRGLARNRIRLDVLPLLREVHPSADRNVIATAAQLAEESEVLEAAVDEAAARVAATGAAAAVEGARLAELPQALRRLVLRRLAEQTAGAPLALGPERAGEIERLALRGGSGAVDLGAGVRAIVEYGVVRFRRLEPEQAPEPAILTVPGRCRFGDWELSCDVETGAERSPQRSVLGSVDEPLVDAASLGAELRVRAWRDGDRIRPLGLGGTRTLQDVFGDRKVPRSLRRQLPVVEAEGGIVWVAGVALSEDFKVRGDSDGVARLRASAVTHAAGGP